MRKYIFIGTEQERLDYSAKEEYRPQRGKVYSADDIVAKTPVSYWVSGNFGPQEWQEVFEEEKVQLTETEKIVLIDFLNDHFEEFCEFINSEVDYLTVFSVIEGSPPEGKISNIIDKIEKL